MDAARDAMPQSYLSRAPQYAYGFWSASARERVSALFEPHVSETPGLARELSKVLERVHLCEALVFGQDGVRVHSSPADS